MNSYAGSQTFQLGGEGAVVDACFTLAGDKVATVSDSGAVQVWSCTTTEPEWDLLHEEQLQEQPTQLVWAHPEHGLVLAVGTASGAVHILQGPAPCSSSASNNQQQQLQQQRRPTDGWCITGKLACGQGLVSALAFAPRQQGLVLAVSSQDRQGPAAAAQLAGSGSSVVLYEAAGIAAEQLHWTLLGKIKLPSGAGSCSCLCWREAAVGLPPLLVVGHNRGGSIWAYQQPTMSWKELCSFSAPSGGQQAVQAVHWAPALGRPHELLAASFGSCVVVFKVAPAQSSSSDELGQLEVSVVSELQHPLPVWKLEFNLMGNTLACSLDGRPEVWFWMPQLADGGWHCVSKIKGSQQAGEEPESDMLD